MTRVAIIHPWFPQYRREFFHELVQIAKARGIAVDIYHGSPPPEWRNRGDAVSDEIATPLKTSYIPLMGRTVAYRSLKPLSDRDPYDLIITEQAIRNVENYQLLFGRRRSAVALWGHGRTYTKHASRAERKWKNFLTRRGDWFFAYTDGGRDAVIEGGFDASRVTVVQNTIDTRGLRLAVDEISANELEAFRARHDIRSKTALYLGGLDEAKRIPFLLAASQRAHEIDPEFRLIVGGSGVLRPDIESAAREKPWLTYLGAVFGREKALALASSQLLAVPGRVGLVAVDSFAARTPIATTAWPWHAPEFEYIKDGYNGAILASDPIGYGSELIQLLNDESALARLTVGATDSMETYSTERMARNFFDGIVAAVSNSSRR